MEWVFRPGGGGDCSILALREGVNYRHSLTVWSHCVSQLPLPLNFGSRPPYPPPNGLSDWGWCKCTIFGFSRKNIKGDICGRKPRKWHIYPHRCWGRKPENGTFTPPLPPPPERPIPPTPSTHTITLSLLVLAFWPKYPNLTYLSESLT